MDIMSLVLALGHSCSFDINLTCYFSSVMRNVTAL